MIQIQGTSELLSYEIERNSNKWNEKVESEYNERNKIYNSCSLQSIQIIAIKIILLKVLNVDL